MATNVEKKWPRMGRSRWPLTSLVLRVISLERRDGALTQRSQLGRAVHKDSREQPVGVLLDAIELESGVAQFSEHCGGAVFVDATDS